MSNYIFRVMLILFFLAALIYFPHVGFADCNTKCTPNEDSYDIYSENNLFIRTEERFVKHIKFSISIKGREKDAEKQNIVTFTNRVNFHPQFNFWIKVSMVNDENNQSFLQFEPHMNDVQLYDKKDIEITRKISIPLNVYPSNKILDIDKRDYLNPENRKDRKKLNSDKFNYVDDTYTILIEITDPDTQKLISRLEFINKYKNISTENLPYFTEITIDNSGNILLNPYGIRGLLWGPFVN